MQRYFCWLLALGLMLSSAFPASADYAGQSDQEVRAAADPILDNLLAGLQDRDYAKYSRDFDEKLKEAVSEEKFKATEEKIQRQLGKYQSRAYLGYLNQKGMTMVLFKGAFDKAQGDVLIRLILVKKQGKTLVTGLWFQ